MAVRADALNDYLTISNPPVSAFPYTFTAWMMRVGASGAGWEAVHGVFADISTNWTNLQIRNSQTGNVTLWVSAGPGASDGTLAITDGVWYFVALVVEGNGPDQARAYGAPASAASLTLSHSVDPVWTNFTPTSATFLTSADTADQMNGRLACVKSWTAALTVAELEAERWYAMPVRRAHLWFCNPMEGPTSAFTQDYSGNGNVLTASGTLTLEDGPPVAWAPRQLWRGWSRPAGAPPPPPPTGLRRLLVGVGR